MLKLQKLERKLVGIIEARQKKDLPIDKLVKRDLKKYRQHVKAVKEWLDDLFKK